jgi:hypothetical protein
LAAPARVVADGLEVSQRIAADPDLRPRRRQDKRTNARQRFRISDRLTIVKIDESLASLLPCNPGALMATVTESRNGCGLLRIEW